jgi:hypothetical protein
MGEKENLLMLDGIQEWFGRRRPVILGKEGAKDAETKGTSTLADILNQGDDDSFGAEDDDDFKDGWVEGVGEGIKDEAKLSCYFRMSEGEDEDSSWKEEGFADLTRFENKAVLVGVAESASLEESTSNVDVGEPGKVKSIFDLVFQQSGYGLAAGLAIPAGRGGSLDIGVMHGPDHDPRQKATIEFWFWVPEKIEGECVLVRRTFGSSADDLEKVCLASDKSSLLWELVLLVNGEVEMRTISGAKAKTEPVAGDDEDEGPKSSVQWSRWNHVCLTFKQDSITSSLVTLYVKGNKKFSEAMSFSPLDFEVDDFAGASALDGYLEKSYLVFALNHPADFRTTELRVWAMERKEDDIQTLMVEHLDCAEIKRKFRVKIKKAGGKIGAPAFGLAKPGGLLAKPGGLLAKPGGLAPPGGSRGVLAPPGGGLKPPGDATKTSRNAVLLAKPKDSRDDDTKKLAPSKADAFDFQSSDTAPAASTGFDSDDGFGSFGAQDDKKKKDDSFDTGFAVTSPAFGTDALAAPPADQPTFGGEEEPQPEMMDGSLEISPLWESAIPLSEQVRSSAAAALIRGPPATRHFGGNRGGLPDYRELERYEVLGIFGDFLSMHFLIVCFPFSKDSALALFRFVVRRKRLCGGTTKFLLA